MPISSYSDGELLSAIRHDDEIAFAELFERYWNQVHAMTYAMVPSMDLQAATKNCVLKYIDSQLIHTTTHSDKSMEALERGMNDLPEKPKKIFRLQELEGLSIAEIARCLSPLKRLFNIVPHNQQKG
jgi:Sigma-70, region 4